MRVRCFTPTGERTPSGDYVVRASVKVVPRYSPNQMVRVIGTTHLRFRVKCVFVSSCSGHDHPQGVLYHAQGNTYYPEEMLSPNLDV
jgi:hypothetical protein